MIQENELHLGYIYKHMGYTPAPWNGHDWIAYYEGEIKLEDLEGVPLDEDWLKHFGFEQSYSSYVLKYLPGGISYDLFDTSKTKPLKWSVDTYGGGEIVVELPYVHTLQNLYFALTGTELTLVKEKTV